MVWSRHIRALGAIALVVIGAVVLAAIGMPDRPAREVAPVMLVLRGVANADHPRGQLDDRSALEYARRTGFRGEVLDVAGTPGAGSEQVKLVLDRIRSDDTVAAIYGFSGGGYNARTIWQELAPAERERIRSVIVVGAPGVTTTDFDGNSAVRIVPDPPEGHLAGPKALLETLDSRAAVGG